MHSHLGHGHLLSLTAGRAKQENFALACFRIKFADHPQLEAAAFETRHGEPVKRAVRMGLRWLIIFSAHEKSGCIHAARLSRAPDNGCPIYDVHGGASAGLLEQIWADKLFIFL